MAIVKVLRLEYFDKQWLPNKVRKGTSRYKLFHMASYSHDKQVQAISHGYRKTVEPLHPPCFSSFYFKIQMGAKLTQPTCSDVKCDPSTKPMTNGKPACF